mmetsp:Transcript_64655/g.122654  ORF Transcript_64655/g.122654 Transcript_64655/m.122654 type:complete len:223 (-) Transcript_64655:345-1013(-)
MIRDCVPRPKEQSTYVPLNKPSGPRRSTGRQRATIPVMSGNIGSSTRGSRPGLLPGSSMSRPSVSCKISSRNFHGSSTPSWLLLPVSSSPAAFSVASLFSGRFSVPCMDPARRSNCSVASLFSRTSASRTSALPCMDPVRRSNCSIGSSTFPVSSLLCSLLLFSCSHCLESCSTFSYIDTVESSSIRTEACLLCSHEHLKCPCIAAILGRAVPAGAAPSERI